MAVISRSLVRHVREAGLRRLIGGAEAAQMIHSSCMASSDKAVCTHLGTLKFLLHPDNRFIFLQPSVKYSFTTVRIGCLKYINQTAALSLLLQTTFHDLLIFKFL